jgi:hypothetical protein
MRPFPELARPISTQFPPSDKSERRQACFSDPPLHQTKKIIFFRKSPNHSDFMHKRKKRHTHLVESPINYSLRTTQPRQRISVIQ